MAAARSDGGFVATWVDGNDIQARVFSAAALQAGVYLGTSEADTLAGSAGADTLNGGGGADVFMVGNGTGGDVIDNRGHGTDGDKVLFGNGISTDQLWFGRAGDDLKVLVIGTQDSVTIDDWYLETANHVTTFVTADNMQLTDVQVENLVQAMSAFSPPPLGQTELTPDQHQQLDPILAANWQNS